MQRVIEKNHIKPILRLTTMEDFERVPDDLRAEILKNLGVESWNPENFDIKIISEDEKYAPHYIRRVESLHVGMQFLLDHFPEEKISEHSLQRAPKPLDSDGKVVPPAKVLKSLLSQLNNTASEDCVTHLGSLNSHNILHYQNSLYNYRRFITGAMATTFGIDIHEMMHILDRAEQFALLTHTRPIVCTISSLSANNDELIAQIDEPLNPFTNPLIFELNNIKNLDKGVSIPIWYTSLKDYEKAFLHAFLEKTRLEDFGTKINSISSKLRVMPAPSNYGKHTLITRTMDAKGTPTLKTHTAEIRSSHIASRDVPADQISIRHKHAIDNMRSEVEAGIQAAIIKRQNDPQSDQPIVIPILYQTLITPIKHPDTSLDEDRVTAVEDMNYQLSKRKPNAGEPNLTFVLFDTNHPLNIGRALAPILSPQNKTSIAALIQHANEHPSALANKELLQDACHKLHRYSSEYSKVFEPYSELYFSTLEQIIVDMQGGISIGSCVSGKDRKAIEIAHTDAMKIYYSKYQSLPPLYSENEADTIAMQRFSAIFADVFCTKHQAAMADFNAPGSFGTKTPGMYLPKHLRHAVKRWYQAHANTSVYRNTADKDILNESDILATNNDIDCIKRHRIVGPDLAWKSSSHMPAIALVHAAYFTFDEYREARKDHQGKYKSEIGDIRSQCYKQLIHDRELSGSSSDDTLDTITKAVILYALLTTESSTQLRAMILNKAAVQSNETALDILQNYLEFELRDTKIDFRVIQQLAKKIQGHIESMKKVDDIAGRVNMIKDELKSLTETLRLYSTLDDSFIQAAMSAVHEYHTNKEQHPGLFAGLFAKMGKQDFGKMRSQCYEQLFNDKELGSSPDAKLDTILKSIILYALITTESSKHLKAMILNKSHVITQEAALDILKNVIEFELRDTKFDFEDIQLLAKTIQGHVETMESEADIADRVKLIKDDLLLLVAALTVSSSLESPRDKFKKSQ